MTATPNSTPPEQSQRTALVTGASSGIGRAIVEHLYAEGFKCYGISRRAEALIDLQDKYDLSPIVVDVQDTSALYGLLEGLQVDVLVNNAGIGPGESILTASPDTITSMTKTNVEAYFHMIRALVPAMVERKEGHVVNIGSTSGIYPIASALYGATKGAVHLLSQNLRVELSGTGVRVTEILPGRVATNIFAQALGTERAAHELARLDDPLSSDDIAEAVMYAVQQARHVNVSTIEVIPREQTIGGVEFYRVGQ